MKYSAANARKIQRTKRRYCRLPTRPAAVNAAMTAHKTTGHLTPKMIDQSEAKWVVDEKSAEKPAIISARRKLIKEYAKATVNLYGIAEFEDFIQIVNRYEPEKTDIDEITAAFNRSRYNIRDRFFAPAEFVISKDFYPDNALLGAELFQGQHGKQRYFPFTKEDFLKYADENYFESSEYADAVYSFIRDEIFTDDEETANAAFAEMMYAIRSQVVAKGSLDRIMEPFNSRDYTWANQKQIERFMNLYMALQSNTRMWWNCGNTPIEARGDSYTPVQMQFPVKSEKVGRNELCPCGSGLKYKKCCGQ